jgi:hypothetical protein
MVDSIQGMYGETGIILLIHFVVASLLQRDVAESCRISREAQTTVVVPRAMHYYLFCIHSFLVKLSRLV